MDIRKARILDRIGLKEGAGADPEEAGAEAEEAEKAEVEGQ